MLKSMFFWFKSKKIKAIDLIFIVFLLVSYIAFKALDSSLWLDGLNTNLNIKNGYVSFVNKSGDMYVVESGKQRVLKIKNDRVVWTIGEEDELPFSQIENVAVSDDDENIYVQGITWDDSGYLLSKETINEYSANGEYLKTLYTADYEGQTERKPKIFNLTYFNGNVEFIRADDLGFEYVQFGGEGTDCENLVIKLRYEFEGAIDLIKDYSISSKTGNIYAVDKRGKILVANDQGVSTYQDLNPSVYPNGVAVGSDESVYFTDLKTSSISKIYPKTHEIEEVFSKKSLYGEHDLEPNRNLLQTVAVNNVEFGDGQRSDVISTIIDENVIYSMTTDGKILKNTSCFKKEFVYFVSELSAYIAMIICIISGIYLSARLVFCLLFNRFKISKFITIELVIIITTCMVALVILPLVMPAMRSIFEKDLQDKLSSISKIAAKTLDAEKISSIKSASDFMNDEYKILSDQIRAVTAGSEYIDSRMGAELDTFVDGVATILIFQDLSTGAYYPLSYETGKKIEYIYENKQSEAYRVETFEGPFLISRSPIFNADGDVVAVISITKDALVIEEQLNEIINMTVIKILCFLIFAAFFVNELIAFLESKSKYKLKIWQREESSGVVLPTHILRLANVAFSISINLSAIFLPMYTLSFYSEELGIPKMLAGSIPLSINILFTTLAPLISIKLFKRLGFKKLTLFGVICSISSNVVLSFASSYYLMTFALLVNGLGFGLLINVKRNYLASLDEKSNEEAVTECLSGRSSGVFMGTIIGAVLYSFLEYGQVFLAAAFADIVSLMFCLFLCKTYVAPKFENIKGKQQTNIIKFLLSKQVLVFIALVVVVWGIISGFSDYYVPIYGEAMSLYEEQTSIMMAAVSLSAVFFGSSITSLAMKKFKENAIYAAMILSFLAILLLANFNNLNIFIIGLLILGVAYSFGENAAANNMLKMKNAQKYEIQKIFSIFDLSLGIGNVIGPMLFGMMIEAGFKQTMWIFVGVAIVLMFIYKIFFEAKSKTI